MKQPDYQHLLMAYFSICRQALEKDNPFFPFNGILRSIRQKRQGETVEVHIVDDCFTPSLRVRIAHDTVSLSSCTKGASGCCRACVKKRWNVLSSHLKEVMENPQSYIDNPALLNWEWLQPDETGYLSLHGNPEEQAEQL